MLIHAFILEADGPMQQAYGSGLQRIAKSRHALPVDQRQDAKHVPASQQAALLHGGDVLYSCNSCLLMTCTSLQADASKWDT